MPAPFSSTATIGNVANKVSNVTYNNAGERALVEQEGKTGQIVAAGALDIYKKVEAADVMKANNEYNLRMNELKNKLLQNKEGNALDNQRLYEEGRQKIIDDIFKRGPSTIKMGRGKDAFMTTIDKDWVNQRSFMERYVISESDKYQDTQLYNQLYNSVNEVTESFADDASVESAINRGNAFIAARYFDYGEERIKAEQAKWQAKAYGTQISAALSVSDYQKAEQILKDHGDTLLPEVKIKIKSTIEDRKKDDKQAVLFNELYQAGDLAAGIEAVNNSDIYKTPAERAKAENELTNYFAAKDKQKRYVADVRYKQFQDQVITWQNQRLEMEDAYKLADQMAGLDANTRAELRSAITDVYSKEGDGLPPGMEVVVGLEIGQGEYKSKKELHQVLRSYGAKKSEINNALKAYDRWTKGEGEYAFKWNDIKEVVMKDSGYKPHDKANYQQAWNEAVAAGKQYILEQNKAGKQALYPDVIQACQKGMLKNYTGRMYGGDTFKYSQGELNLAGIADVQEVAGGIYAVKLQDENSPVLSMTGYELERMIRLEEE